MSTLDSDPSAERFIGALLDRHAAPLRRSEFLKAIRALSARYVERRATLADRSPLDSAGKRAAFAAYYAPLHYLTVRHVLGALESRHTTPFTRIVDLGCGTGIAGAAWAERLFLDGGDPCTPPSALHSAGPGARSVPRATRPPTVQGIDRSGWAVEEAAWTYRTLGIPGRATRGDLVRAAESLAARKDLRRTGVILAWSSNELAPASRTRLFSTLVELGRAGASILIVEPISRRAAPWFDDWAAVITKAGGRQDEWSFDEPRPPALSSLDAEVGFDRAALTARSLAINLP
jgi:hypothetical protein